MKKWLCLILSLCLLLCGCSGKKSEDKPKEEDSQQEQTQETQQDQQKEENSDKTPEKDPTPENFSEYYAIKNIGFMTADDTVMPGVDGLLIKELSDGHRILTPMGEDLLGKSFSQYYALGDGLILVEEETEEHYLYGIADYLQGQILLECEAVDIRQLSQRFYYVVYATEPASEGQEAFIRLRVPGSEENQRYLGYAKVFDAQQGQFVKDLQITDPYALVQTLGEYVCVAKEWNTYEFYDTEGTLLDTKENCVISENFMVVLDGDITLIYDPGLNEMAKLERRSVMPVDGTREYLYYSDKNLQQVLIDTQGNRIFSEAFDHIDGVYAGYLIAAKGDAYSISSVASGQVGPYDYKLIFYSEEENYFTLVDHEDKEYIMLPGAEPIAVDGYHFGGSLIYYKNAAVAQRNVYDYLILSTGETLTLTDPINLEKGLVYSDGKVIELITGETVITGQYDMILCSGNYLYAIQGQNWSIFQLRNQ